MDDQAWFFHKSDGYCKECFEISLWRHQRWGRKLQILMYKSCSQVVYDKPWPCKVPQNILLLPCIEISLWCGGTMEWSFELLEPLRSYTLSWISCKTLVMLAPKHCLLFCQKIKIHYCYVSRVVPISPSHIFFRTLNASVTLAWG